MSSAIPKKLNEKYDFLIKLKLDLVEAEKVLEAARTTATNQLNIKILKETKDFEENIQSTRNVLEREAINYLKEKVRDYVKRVYNKVKRELGVQKAKSEIILKEKIVRLEDLALKDKEEYMLKVRERANKIIREGQEQCEINYKRDLAHIDDLRTKHKIKYKENPEILGQTLKEAKATAYRTVSQTYQYKKKVKLITLKLENLRRAMEKRHAAELMKATEQKQLALNVNRLKSKYKKLFISLNGYPPNDIK